MLFQRNKLARLLEMRKTHRFRGDAAENSARAADAIMQNLEMVLPAPGRNCVRNEACEGPVEDPTIPAETLHAMGMQVDVAVEDTSQLPQIAASPFGAYSYNPPASLPAAALQSAIPPTLANPLGGAARPDTSFLLPRDGPAIPTPAPTVPKPITHSNLLVALETPPPNSSFPRPDHMHIDTPATPTFMQPPTPSTPVLSEFTRPSPRSQPILTHNTPPVPQHSTPRSSRPKLTSRVVLRGRTPMSSGRVSCPNSC